MGNNINTPDAQGLKGFVFTGLCWIFSKIPSIDITLKDAASFVTILAGVTTVIINWPKLKQVLTKKIKK